jgi:hypothetical protein
MVMNRGMNNRGFSRGGRGMPGGGYGGGYGNGYGAPGAYEMYGGYDYSTDYYDGGYGYGDYGFQVRILKQKLIHQIDKVGVPYLESLPLSGGFLSAARLRRTMVLHGFRKLCLMGLGTLLRISEQ